MAATGGRTCEICPGYVEFLIPSIGTGGNRRPRVPPGALGHRLPIPIHLAEPFGVRELLRDGSLRVRAADVLAESPMPFDDLDRGPALARSFASVHCSDDDARKSRLVVPIPTGRLLRVVHQAARCLHCRGQIIVAIEVPEPLGLDVDLSPLRRSISQSPNGSSRKWFGLCQPQSMFSTFARARAHHGGCAVPAATWWRSGATRPPAGRVRAHARSDGTRRRAGCRGSRCAR